MIYLYLALLLIPAGAIFVWGRLVSQFSAKTWIIYRTTGIIGGPVHEMSHATACLLFGLRIRKIALYAPDAITGQLGYVEFSYSPFSLRNSIGLLVQGIAPLLAGGAFAVLSLGTAYEQSLPDLGLVPLVVWIGTMASGAVTSIVDLGTGSLQGFALALLVLVVTMHAIPSTADIALGLKGLAIIAITFGGFIFLLQMIPSQGEGVAMALITKAADWVVRNLEIGMWHALQGAVTVVTLSVLASVIFILLPAFFSHLKSFWDGARGQI
ncbi:hypothetical protein QZH44_30395 (plasmid) [Pseudomonas corrugata]|uniref:hypothetical protein n=1 Tax=Pseudomonas corrugata TaxID=47879 RepID=UPI003D81674F